MKVKIHKSKKEVKVLVALVLYLIFCQFAYAQATTTLSRPARVGELAFLAFLWWKIYQKRRYINDKQQRRVLVLFGCLILSNLMGCFLTYGLKGILISAESSYDYLKYISIAYYVIVSRLNRKDIHTLLQWLAVVVWICTFFSVLQFLGYRWAFAPFQGRFGVYARNGMYRTIGIFAYSIEFGNFLSIIFAFFMSFSRQGKSKYFNIVCLVIFVDTIMSGSRTPLVCEIVIFIIANLGSVRKWLQSILVAFMGLLILSCFWDFTSFIGSFNSYFYDSTPRVYYTVKGFEVWKGHPLFGIGFETYGTKKFREDTNDLIFDKYDVHEWDEANLGSTDIFYSEILPEFGLVGIALLFAIALRIRKIYKKNNSNWYYYVIISALILCLNSSSALFSPHVGSFMWISLGLIMTNVNNLFGSNVKRVEMNKDTNVLFKKETGEMRS